MCLFLFAFLIYLINNSVMEKLILRQRAGRCVEIQMPDGKWKSTGKKTKEEARAWYFAGGDYAGITFGEFAKDIFTREEVGSYKYMQMVTNRHTDPAWYKQCETHLRVYIMPRFKDELMVSITTPMIQDWYLSMQGVKRPLKPDSKRKILNALIQILDWAVFREVIKDNPARRVMKIKITNDGRNPYSDFELHKMFPASRKELLEVWGSPMWACFFLIMRDTGWRPGEIAGLQKIGIMPQYNGIFTTQSVNSFEKKIQKRIKTSDNGYKYKVGLVSEQTMNLLNEISVGLNDDDLLFKAEQTGKIITSPTSCKHFRESCERIGIDTKGRPQYAMRTTFMTNAANILTKEQVEELMGHRQWRSCYDKRRPEDIVRKVSSGISSEMHLSLWSDQ